jgi:MoxR-like ATPase
MPSDKKSKAISDKEFLDLIEQYIPKDGPAQEQISYEEASLKNTQAMIDKLKETLLTIDWNDEPLRIYLLQQIDAHKKLLDEPVKVYSKEEMLDFFESIKDNPEFDKLPIPVAYLQKQALTDEDKEDEVAKINFMNLQVKEKNEAKRLENYKNYLLAKADRKKDKTVWDKIDRKKVDKKISNTTT